MMDNGIDTIYYKPNCNNVCLVDATMQGRKLISAPSRGNYACNYLIAVRL